MTSSRISMSGRYSICFLSLLVASCYYEPSGELLTEIPEVDYSDVSAEVSITEDTIYLDAVRTIQYGIDPGDHEFYQFTAIVKDDTIHVSNQPNGSFTISPKHFANGYHKMSVNFALHSGNGSLADVFQAELMLSQQELILAVDNNPPQPLTISFDDEGGALKLLWTPHQSWNFNRYTIRKYCNNQDLCKTVVIEEPSTSSWTDEEFVGGQASYRVDVEASLKIVAGVTASYQWYPETTHSVDGRTGSVYWSQPKFYITTQSATVSANFGPAQPIAKSDTSYTFEGEMKLGSGHAARVSFIPSNAAQTFVFTALTFLGHPVDAPSVMPSMYNPYSKKYYGTTEFSLVVMDEDFTTTATVAFEGANSFRTVMSRNGQHVVTCHYASLYINDPTTGALSAKHNHRYLNRSNLGVADNGFVNYVASSIGFMILSLPDYSEAYFNFKDNGQSPFILSPSGSYILEANRIKELSGSTYVLTATLGATNSPKYAFLSDESLVRGNAAGQIAIFDIPSGTEVKSVQSPLTFMDRMEYDPISDRLIISNGTNAWLVDSALTNFVKVDATTYTRLINGKLFAYPVSGSGVQFVVVDHTFFDNQ